MTEQQYSQRRAAIMVRMYRHERKFSDGKLVFPRCLRKDMAELEKLDTELGKEH